MFRRLKRGRQCGRYTALVRTMAASVQFIFFQQPAGDVLVRILHTSAMAGLPLGVVPITAGNRDYTNRCTDNARFHAAG